MPYDPDAKRQKTQTDGQDDATSSESQCCGICLLDSGEKAAIRGEIDSCDHFFCFVCIMEWSKVESRCPLCKRRFGLITRPPVYGVFVSQRVVSVPVRDQVYHISGNATVAPSDPYSNIKCSICDSLGDENLLLLCDLCDSASHTHCVGLGATVPEGDWFCHDCTVSKAEHEKTEEDEDCDGQRERPSIEEIVRDPGSIEVNPRERITEANLETNPSISTSVSHVGARTLTRSRNVHARVRAIRANWDALRNGSLRFNSTSNDTLINRSERSNISKYTASSSQQVASGNSSSDNDSFKSLYDVEKAWKMMNKAKSMKQTREKTRTSNQPAKHLLSKINNPFKEACPNSLLVLSSSSCGPKKHHSFRSFPNEISNYKPHVLGKQNRGAQSSSTISYSGESSRLTADGRQKPVLSLKRELCVDSTRKRSCYNDNKLSSHSLRYHESPSSKKSCTSANDDSRENGGELLQKRSPVLLSCTIGRGEDSRCLPSSSGSSVATLSTSPLKMGGFPPSKIDLPKAKAPEVETIAGNGAGRDDPKSDIQVLVKLSLKLLSRDRKLEVKAFKEIARLATHTIMAACGLEQPKPGVRSFPGSVCSHANQVQNSRRMSTLMPNCCRECFHVFVKDVVNFIMIERIGSA